MLEDTGERIIPEKMKPTNLMLMEHLARYSFALPYAQGRVLDMACGSGYGAHLIAKVRKKVVNEVVAADVDPDALEYARKTYYHPLVTYRQADALDPQVGEKLGSFDVIVSFETLEHVEDDRMFIEQMKALLVDGGTLIVSTPFGNGRGKPCASPFHVHQLTVAEFQRLFVSFTDVSFYYQNLVAIEKGLPNLHIPNANNDASMNNDASANNDAHVNGAKENNHANVLAVPPHHGGVYPFGIAVARR